MTAASRYVAWWPDDGERREDAVALSHSPSGVSCIEPSEFEYWRARDLLRAAEEAAEHDHNNRDGWERGSDTQTVMVLALDDAGDAVGEPQLFEVRRECVPKFHASPVKQQGGAA